MTRMKFRPWVPAACEDYVQSLAGDCAARDSNTLAADIERLVADNRRIHESECINLNPATNIMNPAAEALLARGLGSRPSLGYPGDKYEMGLEAIERIEVIAAELACETFDADFAEIRVPSGAIANLYAFMATCQPGDAVIVPPASIGGHVTHHAAGAAGLHGLVLHEAPVDADRYSVDVAGLRTLAARVRPRLITLGGSLNLLPHPIAEVRAIADEVGAKLLFDAAHLCGMIAGRAWPNPLAEGAHLMTMSTYKSLGGPPGGLVLSVDETLSERLDAIAFPGLTANFDAAKSAALAVTLLDWREYGVDYAAAMQANAGALADSLAEAGVPVYTTRDGATRSHQFAVEAARFGGGQAAAKRLRRANLLTCGIGLPVAALDADLNGLRLGTPEVTRIGMGVEHMHEVGRCIARVLIGNEAPETLAPQISALRAGFRQLRFVREAAHTPG